MGVNAAIIMDFHGDLHPQDPGPLRFPELRQFYEMSRAHSTPDFLIIPAEEANVYFGGHWAVAFPKPVLWAMHREEGDFKSVDPLHGTVYRTRRQLLGGHHPRHGLGTRAFVAGVRRVPCRSRRGSKL